MSFNEILIVGAMLLAIAIALGIVSGVANQGRRQ
jgi:hypothetical protein